MGSSSAAKSGAAPLKAFYLAVKLAEEQGLKNCNVPAILSASPSFLLMQPSIN